MDTHKKVRVHISALVDGELPAADQELALAALHTADGQQTWHLYHRIGDALRAQVTPDLSEDFLARLNACLDAEAPPLRRSGRSVPAAADIARATPPVAGDVGGQADGSDARSVDKPKPAVSSVS